MHQTTHKLFHRLPRHLLLFLPPSTSLNLLGLFRRPLSSCSLIRCKLIAPHMGDGTRLVSILIMACGSAAGNTLPICSRRICQMIGVYTPHPPRSVCHDATPYISITRSIPETDVTHDAGGRTRGAGGDKEATCDRGDGCTSTAQPPETVCTHQSTSVVF